MQKKSKAPFNTSATLSTSPELRPAIDENWQARRELAAALRQLNNALLTADVPTAQVQSLTALIQAETAKTEANLRLFGYRAHALHLAAKRGSVPDMSYETPPGMGQSNAVATPLRVWQGDDGRIHASATPNWGYEGPSEHLHGGIISLLFDQLVGTAAIAAGGVARTGTLTIRYHHLTPINQPLRLVADIDRVEGRKQFMVAELWAGEIRTATCEAILVMPKEPVAA